MKQTILLSFFILFSILLFSQSRIGYTESEIRSEFYYCKFETGYLDNGTKYIYTDDGNNASVAYFFTANGNCNLTMIFPDSQNALNEYVQIYNNKFVKVSDTQWKAYLDETVLTIDLFFDTDSPYFVISNKN